MTPELMPTTLAGKQERVIEEMAEVTLAIQKGKRFGWAPTEYRGVTYNNLTDLRAEIRDLRTALSLYEIAMECEYGKAPEN